MGSSHPRTACLVALGAVLSVGWIDPASAQRRPSSAPAEPVALVLPSTNPAPLPPLRAPGTDGTVIAIQPFQRTTAVTLADQTKLWLVDINPNVRGRYLLVAQRAGRAESNFVDIENPIREQVVTLGDAGLVVTQGETRVSCTLRTVDGRDLFGAMTQPVTPFCEGRLLVRTRQSGYRTTEEAAVSLLRSMGGIGESIISIYKTVINQDANLERADTKQARSDTRDDSDAATALPRGAAVNPKDVNTVFPVHRMSVQVAKPAARNALRPGVWYPAAAQPGVAVSLIAPRQIDPEIMKRNTDLVNPLDEVEVDALVYLMAFDMGAYTLDYRVGTDHPGVEWSSRPAVPRNNTSGPDGFETIRPLARVGMVMPHERPRLAGVFVGGFKRDHGAFRFGPMSQTNQGTHYGFIENGVVLSRLQPGLSTMIGRTDGTIELRTWTENDVARLDTVQFARQNGMPLVETDSKGNSVPGAQVKNWVLGNWSGALIINRDPDGRDQRSAQLRSLRSGVCMQSNAGRTWVIYGYFTSATPSAMARVFQAYGCNYAMLLDMNAPSLAYGAIYANTETNGIRVEHLNDGMTDGEPGGGRNRFLSANDNRDFFVVLRRPPPPAPPKPLPPVEPAHVAVETMEIVPASIAAAAPMPDPELPDEPPPPAFVQEPETPFGPFQS
jgi:hypothetical protein